jgi:hypothetical protein
MIRSDLALDILRLGNCTQDTEFQKLQDLPPERMQSSQLTDGKSDIHNDMKQHLVEKKRIIFFYNCKDEVGNQQVHTKENRLFPDNMKST